MKCVIFSAAGISDYNKIKTFISKGDFIIACDGGLNHLEKLNIKPDLIVGDFDSHKKPETSVEVITLPHEKDDTDTFYAVKEAFKRGFKEFLLLGAIGQRFDHSLCNISALLWLYEHDCSAKILDDYSEMMILGQETIQNPAVIPDSYSYFSLMLPFGDASGITIKNAEYNLDNAGIKASCQIGISNEVIKGKQSTVSVKNGKILLIKVW